MLITSLLKGEVFSSQQMEEANNEVLCLQHFLQLDNFTVGVKKEATSRVKVERTS